jgi:hypothetical protein
MYPLNQQHDGTHGLLILARMLSSLLSWKLLRIEIFRKPNRTIDSASIAFFLLESQDTQIRWFYFSTFLTCSYGTGCPPKPEAVIDALTKLRVLIEVAYSPSSEGARSFNFQKKSLSIYENL